MTTMAQNLEDLISEMAQMQRSLPPRPSLDQIESSQRLVVTVDSALAGRLETVILQPRPPSIPQPVFRAYQEMKEDVLRCQAQAEKRMPSAVLELEERHRRFDALLLKVHAVLSSLQPLSSNGAGPSSANGSSAHEKADLAAMLDEIILQKHGGAVGNAEENSSFVDSVPDLPSRPETFNANHHALDLAIPASRCFNGNLPNDLVKRTSPKDAEGKYSFGTVPASPPVSPDISEKMASPPALQVATPLAAGSTSFEPMTTILEDGAGGTCPPTFLAVLEGAVENGADKLILNEAELMWLPDSIGLLSNLKVLNLSMNQLERLPNSIGDLKQLTILDVSANKLKGLPDSLGNLGNLRKLNVMKNAIEELPWTIGGLYSLEELLADFNHLKALPEAVGQLISLRVLSVHLNSIARLPTTMSALTNLAELDVHFNHLEVLPESICSLSNLVRLDVSSNFHELKALPLSIGNLQRLQELDISFNHISVLPDSFALLTNLRELRLEENPFQIPPLEVVQQGKKAVLDYMKKYVANKQGSAKRSRRGGAAFKFAMFFLGLFKINRKKKVKELEITA